MKLPRLPHPGNILDAKYTKEQMHAYATKAMEQEREACAKLVDYWEAREGEHADAIRARGQA